MTKIQLCEICGKPATQLTQDVQEVEPISDENGALWAAYETKGNRHYRCNGHLRKPAQYDREENKFGGYDL